MTLPRKELQGQDAHADEVAAVDPFERLGDDCPDTEKQRPLRGPVAAGSGSVFLAGQHDERGALLLVAHCCVVNGRLVTRRKVDGPVALFAASKAIAQANVRERSAHHDLMVAAAGAVAVEVPGLNAVFHEVLASGGARRDVSGWGDVVGRD